MVTSRLHGPHSCPTPEPYSRLERVRKQGLQFVGDGLGFLGFYWPCLTALLGPTLIPRATPTTGTRMSAKHNLELNPLAADERQMASVIRVLRMGYAVLLTVVTLLSIVKLTDLAPEGTQGLEIIEQWWVPAAASVLLFFAFLLTDFFTPRKKIATLTSVFFGLVAGMVATYCFGLIIDLLARMWQFEEAVAGISVAKVLIGISVCYLCISTVLQTKDDFRLVIPYVEFAKQIRGPRPMLLDTSALIDARILDLADTGVVQYPLVVPQFVIGELQRLADSEDKLKRARGRRGLDVIAKLQRNPTVDLSIDATEGTAKGVDQQLVELASQMNATIVTTDIALNRIAGIQGVKVVNMNEVSNALKPSLIPGEHVAIKLIKPGEQRGQGVGYLEDGTMVVAENGATFIGQRVTLTVTSSLQTAAGRLIFGRISDEDERMTSRGRGTGTGRTEPPIDQSPAPASESVIGPDASHADLPISPDDSAGPTPSEGVPTDATGNEPPADARGGPLAPPKRPNITGRNPRR